MIKKRLTLGVIVGTRGFFNAALARDCRRKLLEKIEKLGFATVILPEDATPTEAVETLADARKCADLFNRHRFDLDGVVVALPNFGDELGIVNALSLAGLNVPVLVQAEDDELDKLDTAHRRDSFCGKLSVCNNLRQYGIPFTDTSTHTCAVAGEAFERDLESFGRVCRVVGGLKKARIGAIGTRPAAFQTMRVSEKLLQASGVTVVPVDLSDIMAAAAAVDPGSQRGKAKLAEIRDYGTIPASIPGLDEKLARQVKLQIAVEDWMLQNEIAAAGIQCWTSIQRNWGCSACLTMSMLGDRLVPCACEVDVAGVAGMYALVLASGQPAALVDWNNNYGADREKCVAQHCSNYPRGFLGIGKKIEITNPAVLSANLGEDVCFGSIQGKAAPGPMTYFRVSTDDAGGRVRAYLGEGEFTADPFPMAGGIAVCRIPGLQRLLKHMCKLGFEHHVGMVRSHCGRAIREAVETYLKWDLYFHE